MRAKNLKRAAELVQIAKFVQPPPCPLFYVLDGTTPVPCDVMIGAEWFEVADRHVANDTLPTGGACLHRLSWLRPSVAKRHAAHPLRDDDFRRRTRSPPVEVQHLRRSRGRTSVCPRPHCPSR